ncbi:MAG: helix-turn-helix domain-containing protein [Myxococcota bacterium]|nr:helix-turn-helix domain-containing protein [Myxococcota bacterium]
MADRLIEENDAAGDRSGRAASGSVGALLHDLRERRGLTIEAVSQETRIPVASLRLVEEGRFGELPAEVFARGFVRSYARAVGADPDAAIRLYEEAHGPSEPPKASRWPGLFRMRRRSRFGLFVTLAVFAAVIALLVSFVYRR